MSPIDDELRTALQRRATGVAPSPDPLSGIERRAGRMRRNRLAAAVAGSVLAVAAVATAVPLLGGTTVPDGQTVATTQPTSSPSPTPAAVSYALDPTAPWAYRGTPVGDLGQGLLETAAREYATVRGVAEDAVALTPLWGQVDEPSGQSELVFVATVDGEVRWGLARSGHSGPEFPVDEPLPQPAVALAAALPGDEVARLVVVSAPEVGELQYGADGGGGFATMTEVADGVAVTPLEGDPATATYRVLDPSGVELLRADVPEVAAPAGDGRDEPLLGGELPTPTNVVDWPLRGAFPADRAEAARALAAEQAGVPVARVASRELFGAERDGRFYGLQQVWSGGDARFFAFVRDLDDGATTAGLMPPTAPGPAAFAAQFDDVLMVVPEPRAGQVLYAPDATSEPAPVADQGTEAAVLIERAPTATDDRLLVLDGDGDPERPLYRGTVAELLAASSS